jgi:hypothetical protein
MIAEIKSKQGLAITNVFVGGGGNTQGDCRKMSLKDCRKMSLEWVRGRVEEMITNEKWNMKALAWEEVNNS